MFSKQIKEESSVLMFRIGVALVVVLFVVVIGPGLLNLESSRALARGDRHHRADACAQTSKAALTACQFAAKEDYNLALGRCDNVAKSDQGDCKADAEEEFYLAWDECDEQFEARQEVCEEIGPGPYLPKGIKPSDFEEEPYGNDYFPLKPGTKYTYKNYAANGKIQETIVVEVKEGKDGTRTIEDVECRVVQDTVYEGDSQDEKIEDTTDWYALSTSNDVWYFGEIALNYEDGVINNIDGSWTAGVEGAKPGIIMYAYPSAHKGKTYRQEFALSEAEDVAQIIEMVDELPALPTDVSLPIGVHGPYLRTLDYTPLEPGVFEDKYYAHNVGLVLEVNPETGERVVLVEIIIP